MYGVLFVCLGNICRSPLAEGVLRRRIEDAGLSEWIVTDSAGMQGYHEGDPPDSRAIRAGRDRGYALEGLRARRVRREDFQKFDLIAGLDCSHHEGLKRMLPPQARAEVSLLMDYAPRSGVREVPDPYYGDMKDFVYALDLIEEGVDGILINIMQNIKK